MDAIKEISVRPITPEDAQAISEICGADLGYPCGPSLVAEKIQNLDPAREAAFVAWADGRAAGFIHVEKYDVLYVETLANILGLAVKAEFQHRGIGKKLLQTAEAWAAEHQIKVMHLHSGISRTGAHAFYRHLGYDWEKGKICFEKRLAL